MSPDPHFEDKVQSCASMAEVEAMRAALVAGRGLSTDEAALLAGRRAQLMLAEQMSAGSRRRGRV